MSKTQQSTFNGLSENNLSNSASSEDFNERIEGTPLMVRKSGEEDWLLTFGPYKLKDGKSKEELITYAQDNALNIVVDMISIIIEFHNKQKPTTNE